MMNAPDLSQCTLIRCADWGGKEHNRKVREVREAARPVISESEGRYSFVEHLGVLCQGFAAKRGPAEVTGFRFADGRDFFRKGFRKGGSNKRKMTIKHLAKKSKAKTKAVGEIAHQLSYASNSTVAYAAGGGIGGSQDCQRYEKAHSGHYHLAHGAGSVKGSFIIYSASGVRQPMKWIRKNGTTALWLPLYPVSVLCAGQRHTQHHYRHYQ